MFLTALDAIFIFKKITLPIDKELSQGSHYTGGVGGQCVFIQ